MTTDPIALLRDAENYLSALHGSVARHDHLAANLACAGCELRDRIAAALPELAAAPAAVESPADRAAVLRKAAQHLYTALFPAVYNDLGQKAAEGVNRAVSELRRMADETATTETSPDVDPVYDPRAWETYRRDAGCGCTAPAPVACKVPHGTGAWLCICHRLAGPPTTESGKPQSQQDAAVRQFFQEPNRCLSTDGIFRCSRPTGHQGAHRTGRTFWTRRPEDVEQPAAGARQDGATP